MPIDWDIAPYVAMPPDRETMREGRRVEQAESWRMAARRRLALAQQRRLVAAIPALPPPPAPNSGTCGSGVTGRSLLIFGESTAAGIGATSHQDALVGQLAARLAVAGFAVRWQVLAAGGLTARSARARLLPQLADAYDLMVVILGVNDMFAGTNLESWRGDVQAILSTLAQRCPALAPPRGHTPGEAGEAAEVAQAGPAVSRGATSSTGADGGDRRHAAGLVVAGVPPIESFPRLRNPLRSVLAARRAGLDDVLRDLAAANGAQYVPTPRLTQPGDLGPDHFHPSGQGYRHWAQVLAESILPEALAHQ